MGGRGAARDFPFSSLTRASAKLKQCRNCESGRRGGSSTPSHFDVCPPTGGDACRWDGCKPSRLCQQAHRQRGSESGGERERGRKRQGASASMVKITELDGDESVGIGLAVHT
jgi:hypothetical protein